MEEVDSIILQTLNQLGMTFSEDITTLNELPENYVLLSTKKCLDVIIGTEDESNVAEETSQKIILANEIISHCKKLGYKGKLGYELLLYPNETDTRKILTFLINKLPKETDKTYLYVRDDFSLLMQNICQQISEELNRPWAPPYCSMKSYKITANGKWTKTGCSFVEPFDKIPFKLAPNEESSVTAFKKYWNQFVPENVTHQTNINLSDSETEANKIIEKLRKAKIHHLSRNNVSIKDFETSVLNEPQVTQDKDVFQLSSNEVASILSKYEKETDTLIKQIDESKVKMDKISVDLAAEKEKETLNKNKIETLSLVTSLLPEIETNMEKLQLIHEKESNKLSALKNEMAAFEIQSLKDKEIFEKQKIMQSKYYNTIKTLEKRVKRLSDEHHKQRSLKLQLRKDCDKRNLKKKYQKKRSAYTRRIMEIIGNIAKQKIEINKILCDTRTLQKEMNNMNGRLDRSFTVVDELVFKDAKKDEHARKTYKLIAYIHTGCGEIVNKVNEIGSNLREIRDLERHVETEKKKNITENLQRVYLDLKYVRSQKKDAKLNT